MENLSVLKMTRRSELHESLRRVRELIAGNDPLIAPIHALQRQLAMDEGQEADEADGPRRYCTTQ